MTVTLDRTFRKVPIPLGVKVRVLKEGIDRGRGRDNTM